MLKQLFCWAKSRFNTSQQPPEILSARKLIAALDRGGVPLNPAKVNAIARDLGLEVTRSAPVEHTIERIRAYLKRVDEKPPG